MNEQFKSEKDRQQWIIANADYFTVVRFKNRRYERHERKTLEEAEKLAKELCFQNEGSRWMIYAVTAEGRDTFVKTVSTQLTFYQLKRED